MTQSDPRRSSEPRSSTSACNACRAARIGGLEDLASVYFAATADVRLDVYGMGPTINDGDAVAVLVNREYEVVVHGLLDLSDQTIDALSVEGDLVVYLSDYA